MQIYRHFCYQNRTFRTFILNPLPTLQNCYNLLKLAILPTKIIYPFRANVLKKGITNINLKGLVCTSPLKFTPGAIFLELLALNSASWTILHLAINGTTCTCVENLHFRRRVLHLSLVYTSVVPLLGLSNAERRSHRLPNIIKKR